MASGSERTVDSASRHARAHDPVKPPLEHPAGRQQPVAASESQISQISQISVMDWLVAVGHLVARKLQPRAPIVRLQPKP